MEEWWSQRIVSHEFRLLKYVTASTFTACFAILSTDLNVNQRWRLHSFCCSMIHKEALLADSSPRLVHLQHRSCRRVVFSQVVDGLAAEEGMEGVREEVPVLLLQILDGELVMLEGLPNDKIRCEHKPLPSPSLFTPLLYQEPAEYLVGTWYLLSAWFIPLRRARIFYCSVPSSSMDRWGVD